MKQSDYALNSQHGHNDYWIVRSVVRRRGGSDRSDDMHHQTGSPGVAACWEKSWKEGADRHMHDPSLECALCPHTWSNSSSLALNWIVMPC